MKDGFLKAAALSPSLRVADCNYNASQIVSQLRDAAARGVKLAVFPEFCLTGYTCEELGIDANAYADWALSNFSYRIDSCYAHTDEGTASLYLYTWGPDLLDMRATLRQSVYSYMSELDTDEAGAKRPLAENEQAHIRGLLAEAIENAEMDSESFLGFQLAFEDGTWVLDLEQAQYQLGIPLGY